MILLDLPTIDDADVSLRSRSSRFVVCAVTLSIVAHAAAIGAVSGWHQLSGKLGFRPPEISLSGRRASIELQASVAASTQAEPREVIRRPVRLPLPAITRTEPEMERRAEKIVRELLPHPPKTKPVRSDEELVVSVDLEPPPERVERLKPASPSESITTKESKPWRTKRITTNIAPVESVDSIASRAVEGSDFDEPPQPHAYNVKPPYPVDARSQGLQGLVLLKLTINATGRVVEATVLQSSGVPSLDDSAQRTALKWNFVPAKRRGADVMAIVTKPVRFTHPGAG